MVWLPVFGNFNMHSGVEACDFTWGLYGHCKSLHWKRTLGETSLAVLGDAQTRQYCTWLFSWTLYQLCYPCQHHWKGTAGIIFCLWIWFQMHEVTTSPPPPPPPPQKKKKKKKKNKRRRKKSVINTWFTVSLTQPFQAQYSFSHISLNSLVLFTIS